ncbi:MAG TPA: type III pantothenate kinase [Gemmataceae bacterium]|nr:type III pantothenate kinase [Gemmataceae bacterium]
MRPAAVADVGNTRIKWGLCSAAGVAEMVSLPADDTGAWQHQLRAWKLTGPLAWAVSGVQPQCRDSLVEWLRSQGSRVLLLDTWTQLPLRVLVERPERVGIDRLLSAVAARSRVRPGSGALIVDAGTAITVNWVDEAGAFRGGAILPGLRLMAGALHEHTALLPLVDPATCGTPAFPGTTTRAAIEAGVFWAAAGGVQALLHQFDAASPARPWELFLTGGDGGLLAPALARSHPFWPEMTLEGIRLAAEAQP